MALYPSLEDMKMDNMVRAQEQAQAQTQATMFAGQTYESAPSERFASLYPVLDDYMGLPLATVARPNLTVATIGPGVDNMVAPLSGDSLGLQRAKVTHGIRELVLCKDKSGKVGMRVQAINKGVFVVLVQANSPAALIGLRFGDQILQINNENLAGFTMDKVHSIIKKMPVNGIHLVVRDRPFERTITLHKDSTGHVGFAFKKGKVNAIVKDSSAARNGLLTEHQMLEVNGQNVVGMDDKQIRTILESGGDVITLTLMPSVIYDHMMKHMATSLIEKLMDHSIPDL